MNIFSKKPLTSSITLTRGDTKPPDVEAGEVTSGREGILARWWRGSQEQETEWVPSLGRKERLVGFLISLGLGIIFFVLAGLLVPLIVLKARRFALLFTLGSICTLGSFSFLWGPWAHLTHILSLQRLPFTLSYIATLLLTLLASVLLHSTPLTLLFGILQLLALLWYLCSYVPGGTTGLWFMTKIFGKTISSTVNTS
ncbi:hypothetical protein LOD99_9407 [Oopsacas minuta]|uniref:Vesicle transport protein n=1 Tax=Oopsacas minuta TaxID=111878 RepID=A0AAV7JBQ9_9METZ|nr:hypothetical protein LOD99_9407 [Oopsacas minuta]